MHHKQIKKSTFISDLRFKTSRKIYLFNFHNYHVIHRRKITGDAWLLMLWQCRCLLIMLKRVSSYYGHTCLNNVSPVWGSLSPCISLSKESDASCINPKSVRTWIRKIRPETERWRSRQIWQAKYWCRVRRGRT